MGAIIPRGVKVMAARYPDYGSPTGQSRAGSQTNWLPVTGPHTISGVHVAADVGQIVGTPDAVVIFADVQITANTLSGATTFSLMNAAETITFGTVTFAAGETGTKELTFTRSDIGARQLVVKAAIGGTALEAISISIFRMDVVI